ncbi:MAG: cupin domain-containing protein [Pseudomonadota bacterium]
MINGNPGQRVVVHQADVPWQASPSSQVLRKRFHLVGPTESGQVTSLVRYQAGAAFPRHGHPGGEEILVLNGIFSDEAGDWPAGTWFLNPEGFSHSPYSTGGCLLFVKLRQYSGVEHRAISFQSLMPTRCQGYDLLVLDEHGDEMTAIVDVSAGEVSLPADGGAEGLVLSGKLSLWGETLTTHDWFRVPPGERLQVISAGCRLYLKRGAVKLLLTEHAVSDGAAVEDGAGAHHGGSSGV